MGGEEAGRGAGAMGEVGHREILIHRLHRGEGAAGGRIQIDVMGDVHIGGAAFDHLEGMVAVLRNRRFNAARLFEALAGAENVAQPQNQKEGNPRKNNDLDHLRAHRPPFHFRPPEMARYGHSPYVGTQLGQVHPAACHQTTRRGRKCEYFRRCWCCRSSRSHSLS